MSMKLAPHSEKFLYIIKISSNLRGSQLPRSFGCYGRYLKINKILITGPIHDRVDMTLKWHCIDHSAISCTNLQKTIIPGTT